jgi:hypothetical protein
MSIHTNGQEISLNIVCTKIQQLEQILNFNNNFPAQDDKFVLLIILFIPI